MCNQSVVSQCKCAQYWPDQGCWTYGNIRVSVEDTMVLVDYTIRKFCIQQVGPELLITVTLILGPQIHFFSIFVVSSHWLQLVL